jgi:hypothetical protein
MKTIKHLNMKNGENSSNEVQDSLNGQAMKKNEELQNSFHFAACRIPFINMHQTGIYGKLGKYMKIFSYIGLLCGFALIFNSCMGGYVASEPSYVEYDRPARPSETHVWIDGDWNWNNQTHVYVQKAGYWDRPRPGQSYVAGKWQSSARGKSWTKGYWAKDAHQKNNQRDNNQKDNKSQRR